MKLFKTIFLVFILSCFLIAFLARCTSAVQKNVNTIEKKNETPKTTNIYFNYPVRDYPVGKSDDNQLYWDCSENDFGNYLGDYNGFHYGEDWNLPGEKDNGLPVYSIVTGKVIKISDLGILGHLIIVEHDENCIIPKPSKEISSNGQKVTYKEEIVNKLKTAEL